MKIMEEKYQVRKGSYILTKMGTLHDLRYAAKYGAPKQFFSFKK